MQRISIEAVRSWGSIGGREYPLTVSLLCPYPDCGEKGTFSFDGMKEDNARNATATSAKCPTCTKLVHMWTIGNGKNAKLYTLPLPENFYSISTNLDILPEGLVRSFISAVDTYNSKNYVATAVMSRRTLEGIFKYLVPTDQQNQQLYKLIETVSNSQDLSAPLKELSHAIRAGGNLGAHFTDQEPDQQMARQMVELLDYLISFLHVLPTEIRKLELALGPNRGSAS